MNAILDTLVSDLQGDERTIAIALISRLHQGRQEYGPWSVDDERDYPIEAMAEVVDALHYCAAELVRMRRIRRRHTQDRIKRVYICHPFADNPEVNAGYIQDICLDLIEKEVFPIAPHLYLQCVVDENSDTKLSMTLCLQLVEICDELYVYNSTISPEMNREIERAKALGIPVRYKNETLPWVL